MAEPADYKPEVHRFEKEEQNPCTYKTYKYRWLILGLYLLVSCSSAIQWPMYVIIDNVIEHYYNTTLDAVNFTATVFLLCFVVFIFPAMHLLHKYGLRFAVIVAASGPCIASLIKLLSVNSDRFWMVVLSQAIIGTTQTYVTVLPASVAAAWFGADQVSTACCIGSAGIQIALAVGCFLPTLLLGNEMKKENVEVQLNKLNIGLAVFASTVLLLIILLFKADPPTPPSETRSKLKEANTNLIKSIKQIVKNRPFLTFWFGYSTHIGIFYTLCFLLNPTVLQYFPNNASDVGVIGLLLMVLGVVGAAIFGVILDKYRRFKETTVSAYVLSTISMAIYSLTLASGIIYIYIFQTLVGIFMSAVVSIGLEVGAEITYPLPENVSSGFLLIGTKLFGFILTTLFSFMFSKGCGIWTYYAMTFVVLLGTVITVFIPFNLKRQAVLSSTSNKDSMPTNCISHE